LCLIPQLLFIVHFSLLLQLVLIAMRNYLPLLVLPALCIVILVSLAQHDFTTTNVSYQSPRFRLPRPSTPPQSWVKDNARRVRLDICETCNITEDLPVNRWDRVSAFCQINSFYFPRLGIIYNGVPKVGCTNWLAALVNAEKDEDIFPEVHELAWVHVGGLLTPHRISNIVGSEQQTELMNNTTSFTFVRNPWVRMVSGYMDKVSGSRVAEGGYPIPSVDWEIFCYIACFTDVQSDPSGIVFDP